MYLYLYLYLYLQNVSVAAAVPRVAAPPETQWVRHQGEKDCCHNFTVRLTSCLELVNLSASDAKRLKHHFPVQISHELSVTKPRAIDLTLAETFETSFQLRNSLHWRLHCPWQAGRGGQPS